MRAALASASRPLYGGWVCSGSPVMAEVMAGSGLDWLLIDMEHTPNSLESVVVQLHAISGYPVVPVVRVPVNDPVIIKQVLDIGAQTILVPMVNNADDAKAAAAAVQYPPLGVRGVGSALARSARWNRTPNYLTEASQYVSVYVQVETSDAVANAGAIAAVDGVDGVFVGPSDLAASMGVLGQQGHPDVVAAVESTFAAVRAAGKPVGVNAFVAESAKAYAAAGASFVAVGADVALAARASEALAKEFIPADAADVNASY
ncbi:2-dehydro-3-deoxyglucarate aldolase [Micrococcales bacterium 31B]|nr:2-dehydro-3-deoxyglucarate aldolase [Micrococcales bacterium 31B]